MCAPLLQQVLQSVVISKLTYAAPAWWGFSTSADRQRIDTFLRRAARSGLWESATTAEELVDDAYERVLWKVLHCGSMNLMNCCLRNLTLNTTSGNDAVTKSQAETCTHTAGAAIAAPFRMLGQLPIQNGSTYKMLPQLRRCSLFSLILSVVIRHHVYAYDAVSIVHDIIMALALSPSLYYYADLQYLGLQHG